MRRLETVRRDFISNLSHELRTPLASLKALTETLREGALQDPKSLPVSWLGIETEVDALSQMVAEILELTRIESGQVPLEFTPIPANRAPGVGLRDACRRRLGAPGFCCAWKGSLNRRSESRSVPTGTGAGQPDP